jgi:hypothetical protein
MPDLIGHPVKHEILIPLDLRVKHKDKTPPALPVVFYIQETPSY